MIGVLCVTASAYTLSAPGRIDIIDGQLRYDVTESILTVGKPILRDPPLLGMGIPGPNGLVYAFYNAAPSVVAIPLVWLGGLKPDPRAETRRFAFSLTSGFFGALIAALLACFYLALGVTPTRAVWWSLVSAFATLLWPVSTSTFDQAQHAFFVLLAVFLGWKAAQMESVILASMGGLAAGILLNYQDSHILLLPALALSTLGVDKHSGKRLSLTRFVVFLLASGVGVSLWLLFNQLRFHSPLFSGKSAYLDRMAIASFGNPIVGLAGLVVSPGKGVLFYSPPIVLAAFGIRHLCRRHGWLVVTIVTTTVAYVGFIASLSFYGGDWAWGPRYLVTILPLWALAFPFISPTLMRRSVVGGIIALGFVVQLLALSLDHQRFFFEHALSDVFWARDRGFYFRDSALSARPVELLTTLREGVPLEARHFSPGPYPEAVTYAIGGNARREQAPTWMRQFKVFYLPRPWPLWMASVAPERRPIRMMPLVVGMVGLGVLGAALITRSLLRPSGVTH